MSSTDTIRTLNIVKETTIAAPIQITWDACIAELSVENMMGPDKPFPMVLEAKPGGRWYRDLGNDTGHFWGTVQVIKPPTLLEIVGPMFMSYAAANHLQYRLKAEGDSTKLLLTHRALGMIPDDVMSGAKEGWGYWVKRIEEIAGRMVRERK